MHVFKLCVLLPLVVSCANVGLLANFCGPNDQVIRYTDEQIDHMSDEQVKANLALNEELERRGCAVAND